MSLRPILLLAAIAVAAVMAWRVRRQHPALLLYLVAEFVTTAGIEWKLRQLHGDFMDGRYVRTYIVGRSLDLIAALYLSGIRIAALIVVVALTFAVWNAMPLTENSLIAVFEGAVFLLAGFSLGLRIPFKPLPVFLFGPIAGMWCFLALFDYGYAMDWKLVEVQQINEWWPTVIVVVTCLWTAGYLRNGPATVLKHK